MTASKHPGISLSRKSDLGQIYLVLRNPITNQQRRFSSKTTDTKVAEDLAIEVSKVLAEAKIKPEVWTSPPVGLSELAYDVIGSRPLSKQIGEVLRKGLAKLPNKERQTEIEQMDEAAKSIFGTGTDEAHELRAKKTENAKIKDYEHKLKQLELIANDWKKRALLAESKMKVDERRALANHEKLNIPMIDAYAKWLPEMEKSNRDDSYKTNIKSSVKRFVEADMFKGYKLIDLVGQESLIDKWLNSLGIKAKSRIHVRMALLQFFKGVGLELDNSKITRPKKGDVKADRKATIWFDKTKCKQLHSAFEKVEKDIRLGGGNWATLWQVHCGMGFRATEVPTLQTSCLNSDCSKLTLKEYAATEKGKKDFTLKEGSRILNVPEKLIPVFKDLVENSKNGLLFYMKDGKPYHSPEMFCKAYLKRLKAAAEICKIKEIYCDAGRNSFITTMLDAGESAEKIALYCGTSVGQINDAYSGMKADMVNANKAAI